jgi:hypothetical protein
MLVEDVIHLARYSELNSLSVKDNTPVIISFINLGLIQLYKEFALNRKEVVITIEAEKTLYTLPEDYMYYSLAFQKIEKNNKIINEDVPINDSSREDSIFFPSFNEVQIPENLDLKELTLVYVTKPPTYTVDTVKETIALPDVLIDCLLHYLGYKGHLGVRSDGQSENNSHYQRYKRSVLEAKDMGLGLSTEYYKEINRIVDKGFV